MSGIKMFDLLVLLYLDCVKLNFTDAAEIEKLKANSSYIKHAFAQRNITFDPTEATVITKATIRFNLRTIHFSPARPPSVIQSVLTVHIAGVNGPSSRMLFD